MSSSSPRAPNEKRKQHDRVVLDPVREQHTHLDQVSLSRVTSVELRKVFDTRSGSWLMASIVVAVLLSTVATILFAPDADLTYFAFAKAIGLPMTVILPMIAILSIAGSGANAPG
jgi:ABC-2 type transport system permease protein